MVGTGGGNSGLVNGDNSAIGVSDQTVESRGVSSSIDGGGSSSSVDTSNNSLGGQMIGTSGGDSGLINRDNSAVGVSDQLCVEVEGASIAVVDGSNGGNGWSSGIGDRGNGGGCGVAEGRGIGVGLSLNSKMISTGSGNSGLINRDNSAIGVSNQLCVEVEGASIAVGGSVARVASIGNRGSIVARVGHSGGSSKWGSGIANWGNSSFKGKMVSTGSGHSGLINRDNSAVGVSDQLVVASVCHSGSSSISSKANSRGSGIANWGNSSLEGQVISTGSGHSGLINRDNSAIGERLESIKALGGGGGDTSGENQKLHD